MTDEELKVIMENIMEKVNQILKEKEPEIKKFMELSFLDSIIFMLKGKKIFQNQPNQ